jgi:putative ABC transport system permease protein
MQQRALASSLTGLSMALGVALMILVIVIYDVTVEQSQRDAQGYHLIIGGSGGGETQLVMNTVFHMGKALYPFPYSHYREFIDGSYAPYTKVAVPYCIGDSYHQEDLQFRVVATTPDLFEKLSYGANEDGTDRRYEFSAGRNFRTERFFEAVIGSIAANKTGLKVGDTFQPTHGMSASGEKHIEFEIVGILKPTGTLNDRALFANVEGFYLLEGHAEPLDDGAKESADSHKPSAAVDPADPNRGFKALPESRRAVTSILVLCNDDFAMMTLDQKINKGKDPVATSMSAVKPGYVVQGFLDNVISPVRAVLFALTILIIFVAGLSILVSIYNSMSERSHDIAVMRALGASRSAVMGIILVESILLALLGGVAGVLIGHAFIGLVGPSIEAQAGITLKFWEFNWKEVLLIPALVVFATLVGFLPALTAYRTDVGHSLGGGR